MIKRQQPIATAVEATIARLSSLFGDRITTARAIRDAHGRGEGLGTIVPPDAVAFPETNDEVACLVAACAEGRVPIVPFGTGTSLEGHVQAPHGGICIDLSRMDAILDVSADNLDCLVQAGVTREQLNLHLRDRGLFFPLDPGANASLGGMAATRASGTNAVRYGTMRTVTLGLTVVTPQGAIVRTGGRARKSSAGYDLTALYVGSEGTLGIITEVRLRLFGVPETIAAAVCPFPSLDAAVRTAMLVQQTGIQIARMELLDALQMRASIAYAKLDGLAEQPTLFLEFHGSPAAVAEQVAQVGEIAQGFGGGPLAWADRAEDRTRLWKARHDAYYAAKALRPDCEVFSTDACVPIAELARCIAESRAEADASGLLCPIVGHVGDGNFHMLLVFDPAAPHERRAAERLADSVARRAVALGGTCTGEHGIGVHKRDVLLAEHGDAVEIMRSLKAALDPLGIMNPGKMLPDVAGGGRAR